MHEISVRSMVHIPDGFEHQPSSWSLTVRLPARSWCCGHCDQKTGSTSGFAHLGQPERRVYICHFCERPTYFEGDRQVPGAAFGKLIEHLPPEVGELYAEARNCMVVSAFTASAMACRKLLMNIAVFLGAPVGNTFQGYVDYLLKNNFVPANSKGWIDYIRLKGNEAVHEIPLTDRAEAEATLNFTAFLLQVAFEFPQSVPKT